jgi:hypothetical protein
MYKEEAVKISANLPVKIYNALKELADSEGVSMTEVLRSAISTEKFLHEEGKAGSTFLVRTKKGDLKQIIRK